MKLVYSILAVALSGCAHRPKCGNPEGARVIFSGKETCQIRIRQVTIGSDLKIPQSLRDSSLSQYALEWVEPGMVDGRIELGHFVLLPMPSGQVAK